MPHSDSTIEARHQVRLEDLDCYGTCVPQEPQYLTDPRIEAGRPSYRFYAELYRNDDPGAYYLADIVTINPSLAALNRIVRQSSLGNKWFVGRFWIPVPGSEEPF